jgi:hypothetical protein
MGDCFGLVPDDDYWYFEDEVGDDGEEWMLDPPPEFACVECGEFGTDCCQQCGLPLCSMHFELGAGFCRDHPDQNYKPYGETDELRPYYP